MGDLRWTAVAMASAAAALAGCPTGGVDDDSALDPAGWCGDGVVADGEQCDDGEANSDTTPDACRTSCLSPWCGDGVTDGGEECDDGTAWGGDGCTPLCTAEEGQLEQEPNDDPGQAQAWGGDVVHGALPEADDVDCFRVELEDCSAIEARLLDPCVTPAILALVDPEGSQVASGVPDADGCAVLDPAEASGARFVAGGSWALCVEPLLDDPVPFYALELTVVAPEDASYTIAEEDDPDGDGKPDRCDDDRDGDGVDDEDDNCPDVPNGPAMATLAPSDDGFLRAWLAIAPFDGTSSAQDCLPSEDQLVAADDASATPALGDTDLSGALTWTVFWSTSDHLDFTEDYATVDAPREIYTAVYVRSDTARDLTLAMGPDDGVRAWLNGVEVMAEAGCQGVIIDYFTAGVTLDAGWNTLLIKVRDQGGGWGNYVRFLDGEDPVIDLELSLDPGGPWTPNQEDRDGDGIGDVCDDTPLP